MYTKNMKASERTKWVFVESIQELLKSSPIDKISITKICEYCHTDRAVFYYHFKDKYDLLAWIFVNDMMYYDSSKPKYVLPYITMCNQKLWEKRNFYRNLFTDTSATNIIQFIETHDFESKCEILKSFLGVETLEKKDELMLRYHSYANLSLSVKWVIGEIDASVSEISQAIFQNYPPLLIQACEWYYNNLIKVEGS